MLLSDEVIVREGLVGGRSVGGANAKAIGVAIDIVLGLAGA